MNNSNILAFLLLILTLAGSVLSYDREMTVTVDAGKRICFFHTLKVGEVIDIEYQVIDGGHGDLDINFELLDPNGRVIFADHKKPDNLHRSEAKLEGDYSFCFDNSFSTFNKKSIFFELIIENVGEDDQELDENQIFEGLTANEHYEVQVQSIQDSIHQVKTRLTKARQLQDMLRSFEARDRKVAEENFFKVNAWSCFQIFMMIVVGTLQVVMVRSLFDTESKVHKIWSKFS